MARMHADELEIGEELVRALLVEQFPRWAELPLRRLDPTGKTRGTVNEIFRLGDGLAVRLPVRDGPAAAGSVALEWLPRLAPLLPVEVPVPLAQGRPGAGYPWFWEIHTWLEGEIVPVEEIDAVQAARDLAELVAALWRVDPEGAPPGRGIPLAERAKQVAAWFDRFAGDPRARPEWERIVAETPPWDGPPVWHHGDLDPRNWLVREGRIRGVIDWESMGVGDPAADVMVAWKLHSVAARNEFRAALPTDDATWERARGWVLSQAVAALAYYTPETNPTLHREAETWLALALESTV